VSALDRDRVQRQLVKVTGCSLKDFCSHHLESFDGRGDHINVENWLNDVEELLAITRCTNEQKVANGKGQVLVVGQEGGACC
jgi:hypothetical protein